MNEKLAPFLPGNPVIPSSAFLECFTCTLAFRVVAVTLYVRLVLLILVHRCRAAVPVLLIVVDLLRLGIALIGFAPYVLLVCVGVVSGGEGSGVVKKKSGAVSSAPFGSAMILPIPWMYIQMMGQAGLRKATQVRAVLVW